jgi:hypothetical protein
MLWGVGKGGEMTQTLYEHMNKKKVMLCSKILLWLPKLNIAA